MMNKTVFASLAIALALGASSIASAAVTNRHKVVSYMFGPSADFAKAMYEQCRMDGVQCREFTLVVQGAAPNKSTAVFVDGHKVGTLRTNALGDGKLKYQSAAFIETANTRPIPSTFSRIDAGEVIHMGRMAGVFFDSINDDQVQEVEVEGEFAGDLGEVEYDEEFEDGSVEREFVLEFEGAEPGEVLDITVNGNVVFTATADENGEVELVLQSPLEDDDGDDADDDDGVDDDQGEDCDDQGDDEDDDTQLMPDSFPSIQIGDVVGIGGATAVMGADDDDDDDQGDDEGDDDDQGEDEDDGDED